MIVSSTEPAAFHRLGTLSTSPEKFGADFFWIAQSLRVGIQRKEVSDLIASAGERLGVQCMKMAALDIAYIVVEGRLQFTRDGVLMGKWAGQGGDRRPWTRGNVRRLLWSCRLQGVNIDFTDGIDDTVEWLLAFEQWTSKTSHKSLKVRAGPVNMWGTPGSRDFQRHLIMGFDGIGAELAERILDTLGMPFELRVTRKELLTVEGLGPKKADAIIAALTRGEANG